MNLHICYTASITASYIWKAEMNKDIGQLCGKTNSPPVLKRQLQEFSGLQGMTWRHLSVYRPHIYGVVYFHHHPTDRNPISQMYFAQPVCIGLKIIRMRTYDNVLEEISENASAYHMDHFLWLVFGSIFFPNLVSFLLPNFSISLPGWGGLHQSIQTETCVLFCIC